MQPSILIADDDPRFRTTLTRVLEPRGFQTLQASDGEEVLEIVTSQVVHLLLLDYNMPRLTGLETLRLVKRIKGTLPCILISARADETLREQAKSERVFSVLSKPVTSQDVTGTVAQALQSAYGWSE